MIPKPGITQSLARFVVDTRWEDIPEQARHEAKRALLNFFAVAIAGCRTEPVEVALRSLAEFSGGKQATIVGLVLGTIFAGTRSLWLLICAHAAFDLTAYAIIYWDLEDEVAHLVFS